MTLYYGALVTGQSSAALTKDITSHPLFKSQNIQACKTRQPAAPGARPTEEVNRANHAQGWAGLVAQWIKPLAQPDDLT